MPKEVDLLKSSPVFYSKCPKCWAPFHTFMRGEVQSWWRRFFDFPYCAVICLNCKNIVGWEHPHE